MQHRDRIGDSSRIAGRNIGALTDLRSDTEEAGIETRVLHGCLNVVDALTEAQIDTHCDDALHIIV